MIDWHEVRGDDDSKIVLESILDSLLESITDNEYKHQEKPVMISTKIQSKES